MEGATDIADAGGDPPADVKESSTSPHATAVEVEAEETATENQPQVEETVEDEPKAEETAGAELQAVETATETQPQAEETATENQPQAEETVEDEPKAEETAAEEPTAEETATENQPQAEDAKAEETVAEEPNAEETAEIEPTAEETVAEEPTAEETATENQPHAEETAAEIEPTEEMPAEETVEEEQKAEETAEIELEETVEPNGTNADIEELKQAVSQRTTGKGLHIHLRDDKLLHLYASRCKETSRRPNVLVNRSIIEAAAANDGTFILEAPGNKPHTFCSRLDDQDVGIVCRTLASIALYLTRVDLSYNHITSDSAPALRELLKAAPELTTLSLKGNMISGDGMVLLLESGFKNLKRLDVSGNPLEKTGGLAVAEYLQNNRILQEVWMDNSDIDCDVLIAISAVLHVNNQTLKVCSLENPRLVNLQGEHCYHFSRMLQVNAGLQEIYFGKHRMRDKDVEIMVSYLLENMSLKVLDLRCNEIGTVGAIALSKWLATSSCPLQRLNLCANRVGENDSTIGIEALADSLLTNKVLSHINLNHNRLCADALRVLGQAIDQRETKQIRLELFHNNWNDEAACAFQTIFQDSSRLFPVEADFCLMEVDGRISVAQI